MKLKELIESELIGDSDIITVHLPLVGNLKAVRRGNWFNDQILDVMDHEIDELRYIAGNWDVTLVAYEEE